MRPSVPAIEQITISTTDPQNQGGVWGVTAALIEGLSRMGWGKRIELIYPTLRVPAGDVAIEKIKGIPAKAYRFRPTLGNTYASHFVSKLALRKTLSRENALNVAVGGGNQTALPFLLEGRPYSLWVSNTVDDEYQELFKGRTNRRDLKSFISYRLLRPATRTLEKAIFNKAQTVLVESKYSIGIISKSYKIAPQSLIHLPYPMDCRPRSGAPAIVPGKYILFVGRVDDLRKNVQMLARAFARINDPTLRLVLAGPTKVDGPTSRLLAQLGIVDQTVLPGFVDDSFLHNLFENARVFVMPSLQEGLCNAVVEALSHSLPVVATRCGGVEDSITDGENGFLVNINDVETMAEKLRWLCDDDLLWQKLSSGAARHVEQVHSWEIFLSVLRRQLRLQ